MQRRFCIEAGDTDRPALWLAEVFDAERCPSWVILTTVCSGQLTLWMKLIREVTIRWVRCVFIDRALWAHADTKSPSNYANSDYCVSPELCSCLLWPDTKKSTATFNHCFRSEIELVADYQRVKIEPKQPVGPCRRAFSIVSQVCFPREHVSPSVSIISHSLFSVCLPIGRPVGILAQWQIS